MLLQPTIEEFTALQQDLQAALSQRETLASQLRFVSNERDLLKERLNKMMRKIFAAKSEARGTEQKDMFFNEAEALAAAAQATPALEDGAAGDDAALDVAAHKRLKRGRKPLDADLPRHVSCATNCLNPSAFARMTAQSCRKSASRPASSWTSFPSRCV